MGLASNTGLYNAAAEHYGVDDQVMTKLPRQKFQFEVKFSIDSTVELVNDSFGRDFTFHRVQGVTLPDLQYNLVKVNQYNRFRHVPTRVDISPFTISFYDTKDNQFQFLLQAYANHYYHGHNLSSESINSYDTITPSMINDFGVKPVSTAQRYFFPVIKVLSQDTANTSRTISMHNCMIVSVDHDRLDYADSGGVLWQATFQAEHVNYEAEI